MPRNNKKYTPEFKIQVIETKMKENLSSYETARRLNLYTTIMDMNIQLINIFCHGNEFILKKVRKAFILKNEVED